ncbi:imidazolonepropionase [Liquorilactobacillus vini]|uniref:Imidazolonepropionase n=1 Tax=Liquorilactobacillus vini DSM 20605 TaxID=1133569 RepID=A0A0R2CBQ6_9LACO|nr:imidazolonepropionase [Liquorilactobacillus vini]KRM89160.1 imidazolonepropionase [Liquorilactobacillus vini DSM 20605]
MKNLLILHASQIATPIGNSIKHGKEMDQLKIINDGAIFLEDGLIKYIGETDEVIKKLNSNSISTIDQIIDATGSTLVPGFIDSHTHFLFAGYRLDEFCERVAGSTYLKIMEKGGGIQATVDATRNASAAKLKELGSNRLQEMLRQGITTVEGKSGYGLDEETELKQLRVFRELNITQPVDISVTYLGAHAIPREFNNQADEYIEFIIKEVLPVIKEENLAEFVDVFCDKGVFDLEVSRKLLKSAKKLGFKIKMHADEIANLNGVKLASELDAVSADHLIKISSAEIDELSQKENTVATLLPCTAFCLKENFAPARELIAKNCGVALASDYNPGSSFTCSIPLIVALSSFSMKMTMNEILTALTLNGAAALDVANKKGSLEPGKIGDIVLLNYPDFRYLLYNTGNNIVSKVIKNGRLVYQA